MKNDGGKNQMRLERQKEPAVTGLPAGSLEGVERRGEEREREKELRIWITLMQLQLPL